MAELRRVARDARVIVKMGSLFQRFRAREADETRDVPNELRTPDPSSFNQMGSFFALRSRLPANAFATDQFFFLGLLPLHTLLVLKQKLLEQKRCFV